MRALSLWGTHVNLPRVRFKRCGGSKQAVLREKLAHKAEDNIGLSQTTTGRKEWWGFCVAKKIENSQIFETRKWQNWWRNQNIRRNGLYYPWTTARATIVAQSFFVITRQPLQLQRCSNPLRMRKVFLVLSKKKFLIRVRGSPGEGSQSGGVFVF